MTRMLNILGGGPYTMYTDQQDLEAMGEHLLQYPGKHVLERDSHLIESPEAAHLVPAPLGSGGVEGPWRKKNKEKWEVAE